VYGAARAAFKLVFTLFSISLVTFLATNALPTDIGRAALGRGATPEQLEAFREQQGLNEPVVRRYVTWLTNFARGDWGTSLVSGQPVRLVIQPKMERTVALSLAGFFIALPCSLALGLLSARRSGTRLDLTISTGTLLLVSLPEFIVGILLILVFAVILGWLPVDSTALAFESSPSAVLEAYALPALALALIVAPYITRMMRANAREVFAEPYVQAAILRGISGNRLTRRYVLPNALPPVVNGLALILAELLSGVVVIEYVFAFPGAGQLLVASVGAKDIPTVQALVLLFGTFFVVLNLLADLIVVLMTPKLRTATAS
jgi:peptide/nickel transport system permease protein